MLLYYIIPNTYIYIDGIINLNNFVVAVINVIISSLVRCVLMWCYFDVAWCMQEFVLVWQKIMHQQIKGIWCSYKNVQYKENSSSAIL